MNSALLTLLMFSGVTGMGAGFADMMIADRKARFDKWAKFIQFLADSILDAYLWYRGVPKVTDAAGAALPSQDETLALLKSKYSDDLVYTFYRRVVTNGVTLLLELLRPSAAEEMLMRAILSRSSGLGMNMGGGTTVVQQLPPQGRRTAAQVREGGPAQGAVILADGTILSN